MKHRTFVQCLAVIVVLILAWVMWPAGKPRSVARSQQPSAAVQVTEGPGALRARENAGHSTDTTWRWREPDWPRRAAIPPQVVRVSPGQVLALVNQMPVQLRDLTPVRLEETEKELSPIEYHSRLQRAIEMELTFQAARDQGVELTAAQHQRLEQIAERHQAALEHYQNYGLTWSSIGPEQVEFEKRVLAAQMLEQNLVAKEAAVFPSPDPEMQARYEQVRRELLDQLQAGANITTAVPAL